MSNLKKYIKLLIEEQNLEKEKSTLKNNNTEDKVDLGKETEFTYEELYNFFNYLSGKKTAKNLIGFSAKVLGGSAIEGILGKIASETGETIKKIIDNEVASETLETYIFNKLGLPKSITPTKLIEKFYGINDAKGLKGISIPDSVSNLIDDKIENEFIRKYALQWLKSEFESNPNKKVKSKEVLNQLNNYIEKYNKKTKGTSLNYKI